jgi:hypothetical protein
MPTATATRPDATRPDATAAAWEYLTAPVLRDDGFNGDRFDERMLDLYNDTPSGRDRYRRVVGRFERFLRSEHGHRFAPGVDFRRLAEAFADSHLEMDRAAA